MKRIITISLSLFISLTILAQKQGAKFQWDDTNWNWGKTVMEKGTIVHSYIFTNTGNAPLQILDVTPGCGCTVAEWTKTPVEPGKSGMVKATFNPKGKMGFNTKFITVKANTDPSAVSLILTGEVITQRTIDYKYTYQYGNLGVVTNNINIGKVKENNTDTFVIPLANTSNKTIRIKKIIKQGNITVENYNASIAAEEELVLKFKYTPIKPTIFGENKQEILMYTNDDTLALKTFTITSFVEEDFSTLNAKQTKRSPKIILDKNVVQLGTVNDNETKTVTFNITNKGKDDLILRKFIKPFNCLSIVADKMIIKKKGTATLTVTYLPKDYVGIDEQIINIISNDPINSNIEIAIKSYVVPGE